LSPFGSAGVSRHCPETSNSQPWKAQRTPPFSRRRRRDQRRDGAVTIDQAVAAFVVAKQHQILAEQLDRSHRARLLQLVDQRRRLASTSASVSRTDLVARYG